MFSTSVYPIMFNFSTQHKNNYNDDAITMINTYRSNINTYWSYATYSFFTPSSAANKSRMGET